MDPKYHDPFWKLSCCGAEVSLKGCILHFCPKCGKRLDHDSSTAQVTPKPLYLPSASFSSGTTGYISGTNQGLTSWTPDFSTRSGPPAQYHSYTAPVISGQSFIPTGNPYVAYPTAPAAGRESIQRHPFSYHTQVLVPVMLPADGRVALSSVPDNIQGHRFDTNLAMSVSQSNKEMAAAQGMAASGGVHMAAFELGGQQLIASRGCDQPQVAAIDESLVHGLPSMRPVTQVAGSDPPSEMLRGHAYSLPEIGETEGSMMPTPCSEPREQDKREMKIDSLHEEVCCLQIIQVRQQEQAGSNAATPSDLQRQTISKMTRECEELRSSLASLTAQLQEKTARLDEAVHEQKRLELSNKNLKDQLEKSEEEVNNLKFQNDLHHQDFNEERKAREQEHSRAESLGEQLQAADKQQQLQLQLLDDLQDTMNQKINAVKQQHAQAAAAAPAVAGSGDTSFRCSTPTAAGSRFGTPGVGSSTFGQGLETANSTGSQPSAESMRWSSRGSLHPVKLSEDSPEKRKD